MFSNRRFSMAATFFIGYGPPCYTTTQNACAPALCSSVSIPQNPSRLFCSRSSATYSTRLLRKSLTNVR